MEIVQARVDELRLNPRNPRRIRPERLAEVAKEVAPRKATSEWRELLEIEAIDAAAEQEAAENAEVGDEAFDAEAL